MPALPHADPGWGVFETMLVVAGRAVELDAHLERLAASVGALYGAGPPEGTAARIGERAADLEHGKLRVALVPRQDTDAAGPACGPFELQIEAEEVDVEAVFPAWERAAALRSTVVAGGLGSHKWVDRRLLGRLEGQCAPGELPLLLDEDGCVLEASRASVFAVLGGEVITPPTDGRILPSIARRQAIEAARAGGVGVREEPLRIVDLHGAEVFLTGSVRGVEPARTIDGIALARPGEVSEQVAIRLRRRWLTAATGAPAAAAAGGPPSGLRER